MPHPQCPRSHSCRGTIIYLALALTLTLTLPAYLPGSPTRC